jgi:hypothetical protein
MNEGERNEERKLDMAKRKIKIFRTASHVYARIKRACQITKQKKQLDVT